MNIDIKIISQLRDRTGAGINDCHKALTESNGDLTLAIEILRTKGEIKAAKKSQRDVKEGVIALASAANKVAVVVINCETDFVARNKDFINTAQTFAEKLLASENDEAFKTWAETTIKNELVLKIGENIQLGNFSVYSGETLGIYLHSNRKIAGIVILTGGSSELARDLAMQVAAMTPKYLSPETVPTEILEKEKDIYRQQLKNEGKLETIWDKIINGKLNKFYEENCLFNQIYIKDDTKKISDLLGDAKIVEFERFSV